MIYGQLAPFLTVPGSMGEERCLRGRRLLSMFSAAAPADSLLNRVDSLRKLTDWERLRKVRSLGNWRCKPCHRETFSGTCYTGAQAYLQGTISGPYGHCHLWRVHGMLLQPTPVLLSCFPDWSQTRQSESLRPSLYLAMVSVL